MQLCFVLDVLQGSLVQIWRSVPGCDDEVLIVLQRELREYVQYHQKIVFPVLFLDHTLLAVVCLEFFDLMDWV